MKEEIEDKKELITMDATANAVQVIKTAILQSQQRALKAINQEQLALYYGIGRYVSANTRKKNWGKGALTAISEQLRKELPGLKGFSATNLKNMRIFYEEWRMLENYNSSVQTDEFTEINANSAVQTAELQADDEIRQLQLTNLPDFPVVAFLSISFTHHTAILSQVKSYEERKFYIQFASDYKVKTEELEQLMKDGLYNHQGQLPNNFKKTIPDQLLAYRTIAMYHDFRQGLHFCWQPVPFGKVWCRAIPRLTVFQQGIVSPRLRGTQRWAIQNRLFMQNAV